MCSVVVWVVGGVRGGQHGGVGGGAGKALGVELIEKDGGKVVIHASGRSNEEMSPVAVAAGGSVAGINSSLAASDGSVRPGSVKASGASRVQFMCLVAAPEGVARMAQAHPDVPIFTAAIDSHLDSHGYIVPGLGDAGDRLFGTK